MEDVLFSGVAYEVGPSEEDVPVDNRSVSDEKGA